jgi:hypothetical protein
MVASSYNTEITMPAGEQHKRSGRMVESDWEMQNKWDSITCAYASDPYAACSKRKVYSPIQNSTETHDVSVLQRKWHILLQQKRFILKLGKG